MLAVTAGCFIRTTAGEARAYDPRDGKDMVLGSVPANALHLLWSPDGRSVAYIRWPRRKDDPDAGVWITDFKTAPRQVFHGWVAWVAADSQGDIIVLKGKPDLKGELWTEKWDGSGLSRNLSDYSPSLQFQLSPLVRDQPVRCLPRRPPHHLPVAAGAPGKHRHDRKPQLSRLIFYFNR